MDLWRTNAPSSQIPHTACPIQTGRNDPMAIWVEESAQDPTAVWKDRVGTGRAASGRIPDARRSIPTTSQNEAPVRAELCTAHPVKMQQRRKDFLPRAHVPDMCAVIKTRCNHPSPIRTERAVKYQVFVEQVRPK